MGALEHRELGSGVLELLGPRWARGGSPISAEDVGFELARLRPVLEGLDQIERGGPSWRPGPGASWLFPRAVALAGARDSQRARDSTSLPLEQTARTITGHRTGFARLAGQDSREIRRAGFLGGRHDAAVAL